MTLYHVLQLTALLVGPFAAFSECGNSGFWVSIVASIASFLSAIAVTVVFWRLRSRVPHSDTAIGVFYLVAFVGVAGVGLVTTFATCATLGHA